MIDYLLKRFSERFLYRIFFFIITSFGLLYLAQSMRYFMPLGDDGVIYIWPVGQLLADSHSIQEFAHLLIASFMGEDHLSPVYHLYGYFCYLLAPHNASLVINISTKVIFLTMIVSALYVVYELWRDQKKLLIFFLLVSFNLSMTWRNMVYSVSYNLSIIACLWGLFFLHRFLQKENMKCLLAFLIVFLVLTFSFETSFIGIPLFVIYSLLKVRNKQKCWFDKVKTIVIVYSTMLIAFLPYIWIHQKIYGIPIPSSRLVIFANGNPVVYYCRMLLATFSEWSFGIIKLCYGITPLLLGVLFTFLAWMLWVVLKRKLYSRTTFYLFGGFLLQLAMMLVTGRYEAGMWTFVGLILHMMLADVIYQAIKMYSLSDSKKDFNKRFFVFVTLAIFFLVLINMIVNPFEEARMRYKLAYESSQAAYKAIDEPAQRIVVVRLPQGEELMHPIAFWLGNQIYHHRPGFKFYPQYNLLISENMNIEFYHNKESLLFGYFRNYIRPESGKKDVLLFKDRNLFTRIYLDANDKLLVRAAGIPYAPKDFYEIHLPDQSSYNYKAEYLEFKLVLTDDSHQLEAVIYGGKIIRDFHREGKDVYFHTDDFSLDNSLVLVGRVCPLAMELIEVSFPVHAIESVRERKILSRQEVTLVTKDIPCKYSLDSLDGQFTIWGTLDACQSEIFHTFLDTPIEIVSYKEFQPNRKKCREPHKFFLKDRIPPFPLKMDWDLQVKGNE